jgi:hypothetical protein
MQSAERSGKLVSSLYPKEIREKLYQEQELAKKVHQDHETFHSTGVGVSDKEAIAKMHPETTIIFADLVGTYIQMHRTEDASET